MFKWVFVLLLLIQSSLIADPSKKIEKILPKFQHYIEKNMKNWAIPGLAIVIVSHDKVLFSKGFGTREVGKNKPVDEHTIFQVASLTKNFTASLAGIIENQKFFSLHDLVRKYVPKFRLASEDISARATLKDLISHCIGLDNFAGDTIMKAGFSSDEILSRLHHIGFEYRFREDYSYSNQMFGIMGLAIEAATGKSYADLMTENIYKPLNMTRSSVGRGLIDTQNSILNKIKSFFGSEENIALCHDKDKDGNAVSIGLDPLVYVLPGTSGVNTTAHDFGLWLQCHLNEGKSGEKQIIPAAHVKAMQKFGVPHKKIRPNDMQFPPDRMTKVGYGMGWFTYDYGLEEKKIATFEHMGGYTGQRSFVFMSPDGDFAVGIFTNLGHFNLNLFPEALRNVFLDLFLDLEERDWSAEYIEQKNSYSKKLHETKSRKKLLSPAPMREKEFYIGTYENELYGEMKIEQTKEGLQFKINGKSCGIAHWNGDEFDLKGWEYSGNMSRTDPHFIEFSANTAGETVCYVSFLSEGNNPIFTKKAS